MEATVGRHRGALHGISGIGFAQRTDGSRVVTTSAPITVDSQLDNPEHVPASGSRRHRWPIVAAVVVVAAAVVVGVMDPFAGGHSATPGVTTTAPIRRRC